MNRIADDEHADRSSVRSFVAVYPGAAAMRATNSLETPVPRDRLLALLRELSVDPAEIVDVDPATPWLPRLAAYWTARDRFIAAGRDVRATNDVHTMLGQVREPLLKVLQISPEFRPACDPLLRMATALGRTDPPAKLLAKARKKSPSAVSRRSPSLPPGSCNACAGNRRIWRNS